jgi:hypothetical protein
MVSSRQPVLPSIFTSDQHKPSIRYEESGWAEGEQPALVLWAGLPPTLPDPEVMQLDEEPTAEPDTPVDWRRTYLNFLLHEVVPTDQTKAQWLARCAKSFVFIEGELYTQSHTSILQHCIPVGSAGTMPHQEPWLGMLSARDFTGRRQWPTLRESCAPAKGANTTLANPPAGSSTVDNPHHLAVRGLGSLSAQAPQEGARGLHVFACRR